MFSEKTKEHPLFLLRLSNLHQTLAAMFKHCKHRDKFSIHKIFSEKFLPGRAFFQNPFFVFVLSSPPFLSFALPPFLSFALPPFPLRAHTHAHTRTRMHTHVRVYAHMMRALAYARTRTRVIYHPIFSSY